MQYGKVLLCKEGAVVFEVEPHEAMTLEGEVVGAKYVVAVRDVWAIRKKLREGFVADRAMYVVAFVKCRRHQSENIAQANE